MARTPDLFYRRGARKPAQAAPVPLPATVIPLANQPPADAAIPPGAAAWWLDPQGTSLHVRVRLPNGAYVSGTIALA